MIRAGYFGPAGTFTQEALTAASDGLELETVPYPTIHDAVMAVHEGAVALALVPIENSLEGSVNATLDALALETEDVQIAGEVVHPISQCLIARRELLLAEVEVVVSHPQANAQCARFIRTELPQARVIPGASTAESVRTVCEQDRPWAAIGPRAAAELYGAVVLRAGVEDVAGNETRFAWLSRRGADIVVPGSGTRKTAIVFWGAGSESPGWLVQCLQEFASRAVNLTRIESRPLKQGLGSYMFFVDLDGGIDDPAVAGALEALGGHVETLRVLGSFAAA